MSSQNEPDPTLSSQAPPMGPYYTQVNILFPATQVELPPAEKFNSFPPEAQKALLAAFRTEQTQRHSWLQTQQQNDYNLNSRQQKHDFFLRIAGLTSATALALVFLIIGAQLILHGAPAIGVAMLITAIAGLVGTAVYGHKALSDQRPRTVQQATKPERRD